jgi:predicted nucleic acid-binding protein
VNVYVESNFVLELTLLQASHASCEAILHLAEVGAARLVIPAFSLIEPHETLRRRQVRRRRMKIDLDQEFGQLARTASHSSRLADFANLTSLLIDSAEEDNRRLEEVRTRLLAVADTVSIDTSILLAAARHRTIHGLTPHDAVVYSSVLAHLDLSDRLPSCFLNADARDFDDPELVEELARCNCELIPSFDAGCQFLLDRR